MYNSLKKCNSVTFLSHQGCSTPVLPLEMYYVKTSVKIIGKEDYEKKNVKKCKKVEFSVPFTTPFAKKRAKV